MIVVTFSMSMCPIHLLVVAAASSSSSPWSAIARAVLVREQVAGWLLQSSFAQSNCLECKREAAAATCRERFTAVSSGFETPRVARHEYSASVLTCAQRASIDSGEQMAESDVGDDEWR